MDGVLRAGAGALLRSDRLAEAALRDTVLHLLAAPEPRSAAAQLARQFQRYDAGARLAGVLSRVLRRPT
jgi:UDP:flavonoid glycosyltransferase YjiC (YdhE family)